MNERKGEVFSIAAENAPVDGCTVSKAVAEVAGRRISHFALSAGTDISPETYDYHKLWIVIDGEGEVLAAKNAKIQRSQREMLSSRLSASRWASRPRWASSIRKSKQERNTK